MGSTGCSTPGTPNVVRQEEGRGLGGGGHFEIRGYLSHYDLVQCMKENMIVGGS